MDFKDRYIEDEEVKRIRESRGWERGSEREKMQRSEGF